MRLLRRSGSRLPLEPRFLGFASTRHVRISAHQKIKQCPKSSCHWEVNERLPSDHLSAPRLSVRRKKPWRAYESALWGAGLTNF